MRKSLMLSNLRIELRRKQAGYSTEKMMLRWVRKFLDEMSIVHSSQIREWQKEMYLSELQKSNDISYEELLQARSSLLFLFDKVLSTQHSFANTEESQEDVSGVFRITA